MQIFLDEYYQYVKISGLADNLARQSCNKQIEITLNKVNYGSINYACP